MKNNPKIVVFGAGAIGGSAGAWIARRYDNICFVARGETEKALRNNGIATYPAGQPENKEQVPVKVIGSIREAPDADIVVIGVKNYSLDAVADEIRQTTGNRPIIVGLQNGIENQSVLPKYFSKVIYGVIGYNAWTDAPGVIGYQRKGPLVLGTKQNELAREMREVAGIFNLGLETQITGRLRDAAYSKLVVNLANSLTTLVGLHAVEIPADRMGFLQELFARQMLEGVKIIKAAGIKEHRVEGTPTWRQVWLLANLPRAITRKVFSANMKKFHLSSMAQDVVQRKSQTSELESLNGEILRLAEQYGVDAPVNRAVYALCREAFSRPAFKPMDVAEVWKKARAWKRGK